MFLVATFRDLGKCLDIGVETRRAREAGTTLIIRWPDKVIRGFATRFFSFEFPGVKTRFKLTVSCLCGY